ncbi:MAG: hypothetical protein HY070_01440, partial [Chloroflexi bacterium]|nr:hypothetical protein [Chloroflexota bacterium]
MTKRLDIFAKITGIKYKPFLCRDLPKHDIADIENAFDRNASFILKFDEEKMLALSWWVSAKRTRSYPYSRIYDTLDFAGKKVTVIPIFKDEG